MRWFRIFVYSILYLSFGFKAIWAQEPLVLSDTMPRQEINSHLSILSDKAGQWTLEDVRQSPLAGQFAANTTQGLNFGSTRTQYWLRFTIQNPTKRTQQRFLFQQFPYVRHMNLYEILPDGSYRQQKSGSRVAPAERPLHDSKLVYSIQIPAQTERTYYLHVNSLGGTARVGLTLRSSENVFDYFQVNHTAWALFFGIMLVLIIYGLLHFLTLRDFSYLYYALFTSAGLGSVLFVSGWGQLYIKPHFPGWDENFNVPVRYFFVCFYMQYGRYLLSLSQFFPRFDRVIQIAVWGTGGLGIFTIFVHSLTLSRIAIIGHLVAFAILLIASALRSWQRYPPAYWVLGSSVGLILGLGLLIPRSVNLLPDQPGAEFVNYLVSMGLEMIFLSMGLSSRYKIMREEKEKAQQEALHLQQQIVDELRRVDQVKDEFLANVSHELRTPLHGIIGLGEAMQTDEALVQTQHRDHLQLIISSAQRLTTLVNDILDFSKIRNQDLELQIRHVELLSLIRLVEGICLPMLGNKPVAIILNFPQEPIWLYADENRVQQILINLLSNAIKFTHAGEIHITLKSIAEHVEVSIQDSGIGIAPEKQQQIFQPFFQADGSISREYGGTGLGLAITQHLVKLHGGKLGLDSQLGQGSTFTVSLPLAFQDPLTTSADSLTASADSPKLAMRHETSSSNTPSSEAPSFETIAHTPSPDRLPPSTSQESLSTETILVVDDEPINVKVVEGQLVSEGYRVEVAIDGFQALQVVQQRMPDLILLDVMMPRLNGYEVCHQLRETYNAAQLPIIMLTARTQLEDLVQGLKAGANDYLAKPFYKEELLARVRSHLQQKRATQILQENQRLQWEIERVQRQELTFRLSQKRLAHILDASQDAVIAVDGEGLIVFLNRLACEWLHLDPDTLLNQPVAQLVPANGSDHPLAAVPEVLFQNTATLHHPNVTLVGGGEVPWKGQLWQTVLEYEETICVFTLAPPTSAPPTSEEKQSSAIITPSLIEELNVNRFRLQQLIDVLGDLNPYQFQEHPMFINELKQLDASLAKLAVSKPDLNPETRFRQILVEVMQFSVVCWEYATQTTLIELAQKSGLWSVHTDENRVRARAAERYLDLKHLPQKPRWRTVVRTANYVLGHCTLPLDKHSQLDDLRNQLLQLIHQRHLS